MLSPIIRRATLVALVASIMATLGCAGARPSSRAVPRPAYRKGEGNGRNYAWWYVRPRAFPDSTSLSLRRAKLIEWLRDSLVYVPPFGTPGDKAAGPCRWRPAGPTNVYGRVTSIAIDPTNPTKVLIATVGGLWRSTDGARSWRRVSDQAGMQAGVWGAVAISKARPDEVFAGGGDPNRLEMLRAGGPGLWFSPSGGQAGSWQKLDPVFEPAIVFAIRIEPTVGDLVYVATSQGVYAGTRSGSTWSWSRLGGFANPTSGLDVTWSATPVVYAGAYDLAGARQAGIWKYNGSQWSHVFWDGGSDRCGVTAIAVSPSNPMIVYAKLEDADDGMLLGVYRSSDAGVHWDRKFPRTGSVSCSNVKEDDDPDEGSDYTHYNCTIAVDKDHENIVYVGDVRLFRSTSGGDCWEDITTGPDPAFQIWPIHADQHAIAFDPANPRTLFVGNDGGVVRAEGTDGSSWHWDGRSHGVSITEFYSLATQRDFESTALVGGSQDNGSEVTFGNRTWFAEPTCDGLDVAYDARYSSTVLLGCHDDIMTTWANPVVGTEEAGAPVDPLQLPVCSPVVADDVVGRALAFWHEGEGSPYELRKTTNSYSWDPAGKTAPAGTRPTCLAIERTGFQTWYVGFADADESNGVTPSSLSSTRDAGASWNDFQLSVVLSPNAIAVDPTNRLLAYVALGGSSGGAVWFTSDGGVSWSVLPSTGLPGTAACTDILVDPQDPRAMYLATDVGVFRGTRSAGAPYSASWDMFSDGLPLGVDVTSLALHESERLLVAGTMGCGAFEFDLRSADCPERLLLVRDNVFDRGIAPAPSGIPDPEHPVPDLSRAVSGRPELKFFKANETEAGRVYWYLSEDIKIDIAGPEPRANKPDLRDAVAVESCPPLAVMCGPGEIRDVQPQRGRAARVFVQVHNRGTRRVSSVRVVALYTDATLVLPPLPNNFWSTTFPSATSPIGALAPGSAWHFPDASASTVPATRWCDIPFIDPDQSEVVEFRWDVPSDQAEHSCMMVIVDSPDDPIPAAVRNPTPMLDPNVLVPQERHVGLRNLHVVDRLIGTNVVGGIDSLTLFNLSALLARFELIFDGADLDSANRLFVELPTSIDSTSLDGLSAIPALPPEFGLAFGTFGTAQTTFYEVTEDSASIDRLEVIGHGRRRVPVFYMAKATTSRRRPHHFSMIAKRAGHVLGGSMWILRPPP